MSKSAFLGGFLGISLPDNWLGRQSTVWPPQWLNCLREWQWRNDSAVWRSNCQYWCPRAWSSSEYWRTLQEPWWSTSICKVNQDTSIFKIQSSTSFQLILHFITYHWKHFMMFENGQKMSYLYEIASEASYDYFQILCNTL